MGIKVFVDDVRNVEDYRDFYDNEWETRRTITEVIKLLHSGYVDEISLDHDIMHSSGIMTTSNPYGSFCECPEDYSCIADVIAMMPKDLRPRRVIVHSANGAGRYKMLQTLKDSGCELIERGVDHPHGKYVGPMKDPREEN